MSIFQFFKVILHYYFQLITYIVLQKTLFSLDQLIELSLLSLFLPTITIIDSCNSFHL